MTNSLIPHTFTPGTKAKAQEVNANFIALAEEIQSTQQSTTNRFAQVNQAIENSNDEAELKFSDKDLIKTKTLSNVVIKAPNGVLTYNNQTVTVKNGLVVLIPSGLNSDGKFECVQYTLSSDVSKTVTNCTSINTTVFLYSNGTLDIVDKSMVYYSDTSVTTDGTYKFLQNKWYKYSSTESSWQEIYAIPVADLVWDSNSIISSAVKYPMTGLVTKSDFSNIEKIDGLMPAGMDYIVEMSDDNGLHIAKYRSGWVEFSGRYNVQRNFSSGASDEYTITLPISINIKYYNAITETFCFTIGGYTMGDNRTVKFSLKNTHNSTIYLNGFIWRITGYII